MRENPETPPPPGGQFLVYQAEDGKLKIDVRMEGETVWLTQQQLAELFQTTQQNVSLHLSNIFEEGELERGATHKEFLSVRQEGRRSVQRRVDFYKLDAIISVGYRIKSAVATRFRIWATQRLQEFIVKGFTMDDERLKNPDQPFDYFDELMRRIQDIRTSERRFYQKITDIYATSIDYDPTQKVSLRFFKTVQDVKDLPALKNFFKAYVTNGMVRVIIESKQFTALYTTSAFTTEDLKAVPLKYRTLIPEYI